MIEDCDMCKYFKYTSLGEGECRRNAPKGIIAAVMTDDETNLWLWPIVQVEDWCGEWELAVDAYGVRKKPASERT